MASSTNLDSIELTAANDIAMRSSSQSVTDPSALYHTSTTTSPQSSSPHVSLAIDQVAYSPLATHATHLSSRRTFAGGILRYYTSPQEVLVSSSRAVGQSPLLALRSVYSSLLSGDHWSRVRRSFQLHLFGDIAIWKAALIEMLGTLLLTFMVLVTVTSILNHKQDYSYFPTAIAICHIPIIAFMIFATATATGGRQTYTTHST